MKKKHKFKLSVIFIAGISIILITITIALSYISIGSLTYLGDYAISSDKKNIKDTATLLFMEITNRTAEGYSSYFNETGKAIAMLAKQAERMLKNKSGNIKETIKLTEYIPKSFYDKQNSFFIDPGFNDKKAVLYWGNKDSISETEHKIDYISSWFFPYADTLLELNKKYYFSIWYIQPNYNFYIFDTYEFQNKNSEFAFYEKIQNKTYLKNYFDAFEKSIQASETTVWIKPYKGITKQPILSAYSSIIDKQTNELMAIVGVDIDFTKIIKAMAKADMLAEERASQSKEWETIYDCMDDFTFLIDKNANIILFPDNELKDFQLNGIEWDKLNLRDSKNPEVIKLADEMTSGYYGVSTVCIGGINHIVAFNKIKSTGWTLGFVTHESALMLAAKQTEEKMSHVLGKMNIRFLIIACIFLIATIIIIVMLFKYFLFKPIKTIRKEIGKLATGDFNINLKEAATVEISELSEAFNYLGRELGIYTENLKKEVSARQAIETEIEIATRMQNSILPKSDIFPNYGKFDLFAKLSPAKEVSGDFYDFFYLDNNRIAFLIADVSGKSLPAAFFMAMSKVIIKNQALRFNENPAAVLEHANNILSIDNKAGMFTTVLLVFYNLDSGELSFANAGHDALLILNQKGKIKKLGRSDEIALGLLPEAKYTLHKKILEKDETVILFTDGVTEAYSNENKQYGDLKLYDLLKQNIGSSLQSLSEQIVNDVRNFESGNRFDDITLVLFRKTV